MWGWLKRFASWWAARLEEKSTWAGVALLAAGMGKHVPDVLVDALDFWGPLVATGLIAASTNTGDKT